jgi:exonuclease III
MEPLKLTSYNCHGFKNSIGDLLKLCTFCHLICIQEHWLFPGDIADLTSIHNDFSGFGVSAVDPTQGIIKGRPYGGVGILWHKRFSDSITEIYTGYNWVCGININTSDGDVVVYCVYLPYEKYDNIDEYVQCLAVLHNLIQESSSNMIYIIGDFNCDMKKSTIYSEYLSHFVEDTGCVISDYHLLCKKSDVYTYVSPAWGSTSWLDHCVSTENAHNVITSASVLADYVCSDHVPLCIEFNIEINTSHENNSNPNAVSYRPCWDKASHDELSEYSNICTTLFESFDTSAIESCNNVNCTDVTHHYYIDNLYNYIIESLHKASNEVFVTSRKPKANIVPGWNDYVKDAHLAARDAFVIWNDAGKPKFGPVFDIMKRSRAVFKYCLRYCKRNEAQLRANATCDKMIVKDHIGFWKDIQSQQNKYVPSASVIDGVKGTDAIVNMWMNHYKNIFCNAEYNYNDTKEITNNMSNVTDENMYLDSDFITEIIFSLPNGKSSGVDNITAEHLKYAGDKLSVMLSTLFSSIFVHGYLPQEMIKSVIVPVIKNKTKSSGAKSNYRPVTLATIVSKVLEKVIYVKTEPYLYSSDNQFGFKKSHGTEMCVFVLKEILRYYVDHGSKMYVSFIDASMAFDNINQCKLFLKLFKRNIPVFIIRVLWYWYKNQQNCVKWNNVLSEYFCTTNGVRQGGLLSPLLYNVYIDKLTAKLNLISAGCCINNIFVNHLMYADDIVLFAPSAKGLQKLVNACYEYGNQFNIKFNQDKSVCMIVDYKKNNDMQPIIRMGNNSLQYVNCFKYLGHNISCTLSDNEDIDRQMKSIYVRANTLIRKFNYCNDYVKCKLFKSFCTNLYCCSLWSRFTIHAVNRIKTAYNNSFRILLGLPKYCSASQMFTLCDVQTFDTVLRKQRYSLLSRLNNSANVYINAIMNGDLQFNSHLIKTMYKSIYV